MPLIPIDSLSDPRLEAYRNLKTTNRIRDLGWFVAEGVRVVERLLASDFEVQSVLITDHRQSRIEPLIPDEIPVYLVSREMARGLIGYEFHSGVMACGVRTHNPELRTLVPNETQRATIVACSHITDMDNLGTIIRTATAFGVTGLLLSQDCADEFSRRGLRISMGNALYLPTVRCNDLAEDLSYFHDLHDFEIVATVLADDAERLVNATRASRTVLVFGNEGYGIADDVLAICNRRVTIPVGSQSDSLNVAVAAGIFLHHFAGAT
jgi:tRNA G18 (ribose-2'-O)-methylase SpoU